MSRSASTEVLGDLPRVSKQRCRCGVMMADCFVPVGDEAVPACWICAHDYVEHDRPLGGGTSGVPCSCAKEDIYPTDVLEARAAAVTATA